MADIEGEYREADGYKRDKNGVLRDSKGRIVKGSGPINPEGRPTVVGHIREVAKQWTPEAIETLGDIMRNAEKDRDRAYAATYLLDRAWGKPSTSVEVSDKTEEKDAPEISAQEFLNKIPDSEFYALATTFDEIRAKRENGTQSEDDEDAT